MRLFTHNFLQCNVKGCTQDNYPLHLSEAEVQVKEAEYHPEFISRFIHKIDWDALRTTCQELNINAGLPEAKPEEPLDQEALQTLHKILFEHYLNSGKMTCNGCGHVYSIKDGIPNMLLAEDEV